MDSGDCGVHGGSAWFPAGIQRALAHSSCLVFGFSPSPGRPSPSTGPAAWPVADAVHPSRAPAGGLPGARRQLTPFDGARAGRWPSQPEAYGSAPLASKYGDTYHPGVCPVPAGMAGMRTRGCSTAPRLGTVQLRASHSPGGSYEGLWGAVSVGAQPCAVRQDSKRYGEPGRQRSRLGWATRPAGWRSLRWSRCQPRLTRKMDNLMDYLDRGPEHGCGSAAWNAALLWSKTRRIPPQPRTM